MISFIRKIYATLWLYLGLLLTLIPILCLTLYPVDKQFYLRKSFIKFILQWMEFGRVWKINYYGKFPFILQGVVAVNQDSLLAKLIALQSIEQKTLFVAKDDANPQIADKIKEGYTLLVEPHNCRTITFDTEALNLSHKHKLPIVPIIIRDVSEVFSYGIADIGEISVSYCDPVSANESLENLTSDFRSKLLSGFQVMYTL